MYKSLTKIAITGGPCGGKTSGLAKISSSLSDKSYEVIVIPEAATFIKNAGVKIAENYISGYEFEEMIFKQQVFFEKLFEEYAEKLDGKNVILVCDRGIVDGKAYLADECEYNKLLSELGLNPIEVRDSYDAVFHLKTVADGKEEYYTCENNEARKEKTPEEAREADRKTIKAWIGHPHFRVIDNSTNFEGKMTRLMAEIYSFLGLPTPIETERKYLIRMPDITNILEKYNAVKSDIVQVYLISENKNEEVRIRQRGENGSYTYYLTKKIKRDDMSRYEVEEKITKERYLDLLMQADTSKSIIRKTRYCFVYENQYFEMDIYPFSKEKAILEIELTDENNQVNIPADISVIREVTDEDSLKNANIAKDKNVLINA